MSSASGSGAAGRKCRGPAASTASSSTSRGAPARSSGAPTSPNTSGTRTTTRSPKSSTSTSSASGGSSTTLTASPSSGRGAARAISWSEDVALSLRARLTAWYSVLLLLTLAVFTSAVLWAHWRLLVRQLDESLDSTALTAANVMNEELGEEANVAAAAAEMLSAVK